MLVEHHSFRNLHVLVIKRHGYKRVKASFADLTRVTSLTRSQGCELFSPKQENGQKLKVNSNFLSTVNDLKNVVWAFGSINNIIIEQCPSCLLNLVNFQLRKLFFWCNWRYSALPCLYYYFYSMKILFCFYDKYSYSVYCWLSASARN